MRIRVVWTVPDPGQQFVDPADGVVGDALEYVVEIDVRVEAVESTHHHGKTTPCTRGLHRTLNVGLDPKGLQSTRYGRSLQRKPRAMEPAPSTSCAEPGTALSPPCHGT